MQRVLVVDDESDVREAVARTLDQFNFDVQCAVDGEEAMDCLSSFDPDLIVLDIVLPGISGKDLLRELRRTHSVPIIFLSGLDNDVDRIVGLELGADDYLTKPFHPGELLARVRAVLRRTSTSAVEAPVVGSRSRNSQNLQYGRVTVDPQRHLVLVDDHEVDLTKTEFLLLKTLMRHPTRVYSRDELMEGAYGPATYVSDRTINSHIRRLRSKLEEAGIDPIETVRGVGYRVAAREGAQAGAETTEEE